MSDIRDLKDFLLGFFTDTAIAHWSEEYIDTQINQTAKIYPRLPHHKLLDPAPLSVSLTSSLMSRRSNHQFTLETFTYQDISTLLSVIGRHPEFEDRRLYPSAGAKYSAETYFISLNSERLAPGLYHYNVERHELVELWLEDLHPLLVEIINDSRIMQCSAVFVFSSVFGRTVEKYDKRGLRYSLFEIGHMAQNLSLAASALQKGCCEIGGFLDSPLNKLLDVEEESETATLMMILGGKA